MRTTSDDHITPLTPQSFYILLALLDKPHYGYSLVQQIEQDSGGAIQISPGSIYKALDRLDSLALISVSRTSTAERSPYKRKHYRLTPYGKQILLLEAKRLTYATGLVKTRLSVLAKHQKSNKSAATDC